jgi:octaprenyl-diphosphate synthase
MGDFLYSRAFELIVNQNHLGIIQLFAKGTNIIAEGEILQLLNCGDANTSTERYFDIIQRKTGKLFEISAQLGAAYQSATESQLTALGYFGMQLGLAYQLIDDALDYTSDTQVLGKPKCNDFLEGKPTLPLIYALSQSPMEDVLFIKESLQCEKTRQDALDRAIQMIESTQAIRYTLSAAQECADKACQTLSESFPQSPYRDALVVLAKIAVERLY